MMHLRSGVASSEAASLPKEQFHRAEHLSQHPRARARGEGARSVQAAAGSNRVPTAIRITGATIPVTSPLSEFAPTLSPRSTFASFQSSSRRPAILASISAPGSRAVSRSLVMPDTRSVHGR
jgi:hypothetical protein